ncbi:MAG: hypothetical protein GXY85_03015 [Candidatus Brocadiaceae bacterium]|nr:hypothetical protein [Candidatus Brocadiaceae bacterium]
MGEWGTGQTVLVVVAVIILIVLIVLMSTRKPGPPLPKSEGPGPEDAQTPEESEVEGPG